MRLWTAVLLLCLTACDSYFEATFQVDGVPVVLENGVGPPAEDMRLAVQAYRQAGYVHWGLHPREDMEIWRQLTEIRWTEDVVLGHMMYDYDRRVLLLYWDGCVLATPFYAGLADHYSYLIFDDATVSTAHRVWAESLKYAVGSMLCPEYVPR